MNFMRILFDGETAAAAAGDTTQVGLMGMWPMLLMLAAVFAIFYFMMIRPEKKRKQEAEDLRNALKKGDKITTIGGIMGTIVSIKDDVIVIETSEDQVRMELQKWSVMTNNTAEEKKKKEQAESRAAAKRQAEERAKEKAERKANRDKR